MRLFLLSCCFIFFIGCSKSPDPLALNILKAKEQIKANQKEAIKAQEEYKKLQQQRTKE